MNTHIPTYEEAINLVKMDNSPFYETVNYIDGYKVSVFNYRLATTNDFKLSGSLEMRGMCFVFNEDDSLYERYLLLHKFFNLNQIDYTQYNLVDNLTVKNVYNKEDGSLATFIRLPNGRIIGKTKMGFDNDQAISINNLYNTNNSIKVLVDYLLDNNLIPIFEYVAPDNKIVLDYFEKKLILLKVRNNTNGEYLDLDLFNDYTSNINIVEKENYSLDKMIQLSKNLEKKEGWVVEFTNGLFIKIKTEWYFRIHMLLTEDIQRENKLIEYVLDEKIDDILSQIPLDDVYTRKKIDDISETVLNKVNILKNKIDNAYSEYVKSNLSFKEYAIDKKENDMFSFVALRNKNEKIKLLSTEEIYKIYNSYENYEKVLNDTESFNISKNYIRKKTFRLIEARKWLNEVKE